MFVMFSEYRPAENLTFSIFHDAKSCGFRVRWISCLDRRRNPVNIFEIFRAIQIFFSIQNFRDMPAWRWMLFCIRGADVGRVVSAVPPRIRRDQVDFIAIQGSTVRLPCRVDGDPRPQITWTKNGIRISDNDPHYFVNKEGSLDIFSVRAHDTATYSCTAMNIAGIQEQRLSLFVQGNSTHIVHSILYTLGQQVD